MGAPFAESKSTLLLVLTLSGAEVKEFDIPNEVDSRKTHSTSKTVTAGPRPQYQCC